jgi:hypothetical protein
MHSKLTNAVSMIISDQCDGFHVLFSHFFNDLPIHPSVYIAFSNELKVFAIRQGADKV